MFHYGTKEYNKGYMFTLPLGSLDDGVEQYIRLARARDGA